MLLTLSQSFPTAVRPSERVMETAAMFGLGVDDRHSLTIVPPAALEIPTSGGGIVFITGPSGGGKSTILRLIREACLARGTSVIELDHDEPLPDLPLVDCFDLPLARTMELLALAGLGEAFLMLRTPAQLSDGQRARLRLARCAAKAHSSPGAVILADEFCATLDRLTARLVARSVRRWVDRAAVTFIAATTHDDLLEALQPDVLIFKGLGGEISIIPALSVIPAQAGIQSARSRSSQSLGPRLRGDDDGAARVRDEDEDALILEEGSPRDYLALAPFHYKGGRPGVVTTLYRLVHEAPTVVGRYLQRRSERSIVGVLLRALPHLGCGLRDEATRGRYRGFSRSGAAMLLNREVRTIARVVIHPQWRGTGLAVRLVEHALAHPEPGQVYTESLAAMGRVHPFFEKAGMMRYDRPHPAAHQRLLDAMARLEMPPWMLASPRAMLHELEKHDEPTQVWFEHEVVRWHNRGARRKRTRTEEPDLHAMLEAARDRVLATPVYYLFRHEDSPRRATEECNEKWIHELQRRIHRGERGGRGVRAVKLSTSPRSPR